MSEAQNVNISDDDMPAMFRAADQASAKSQLAFLRWTAIDLLLIIASSVLGAFSFSSEEQKTELAIISASLMCAGFLLTLYLRAQKFEQSWYDGRAVAESLKTSAWRFMTCSDPYVEVLTIPEVTGLFIKTLEEVVQERRDLASSLDATVASESQISQKMQEVRKMSFDDRKSIYLSQRVENQRAWYSRKSVVNKNSASTWFNVVMISQLLALIFSLSLIKYPNLPINISTLFATAAAASIAWLQLKRHQELSNSYSLAAQELRFIIEQAQNVTSSDELSNFVLSAENAISREHTMWKARRVG